MNTKVLCRDMLEQVSQSLHPGITPRNDFELIQLSSRTYPGTPAEVYAALEQEYKEDHENGMGFAEAEWSQLLNEYVEPTGVRSQYPT